MLVAAALWSVGLVAAGATVPVYRTASAGSDGSVTSHGETLIGENGAWVVVVLVVPLIATLLVAGALLTSRDPWALWFASVVTGLLAAVNLPAMLTIGIFVLPVTAALVGACLCGAAVRRSTHPRPLV